MGISDDRFALAFYGAEPSAESIEHVFKLVVAWFTRFGFPPERLGLTYEGRVGKMGSFARGRKKIEVLGFSGLDTFSMTTLLPKDISGALYIVSAVFSRGDRLRRYFVVSVPSSWAKNDVWLPVAREIIGCLRPAYGIAYERPLLKGPVFYALGVNAGTLAEAVPTGDDYDRNRSIARWSNVGIGKEVYREGLLRNVYRWNFLTRPQLERDAEGMPLAEWIQADPRRGTLGRFAEDVWLWEVDEAELASIRDRLHDANVIFDWRKYLNIEPHIKTVLG